MLVNLSESWRMGWSVDWTHLAQDRVQWRAFVNRVISRVFS
jgi:hypothetical protein